MSENKLKTCPFCGGEHIEIEPMNRWRKSITCKNCHAKFVAPDNTTLIRLWNTRKPTERIVEQLNKRIEVAGRIMVEKPADKLDEIANNAAEDFIQAYEECIELIEKDGAE